MALGVPLLGQRAKREGDEGERCPETSRGVFSMNKLPSQLEVGEECGEEGGEDVLGSPGE